MSPSEKLSSPSFVALKLHVALKKLAEVLLVGLEGSGATGDEPGEGIVPPAAPSVLGRPAAVASFRLGGGGLAGLPFITPCSAVALSGLGSSLSPVLCCGELMSLLPASLVLLESSLSADELERPTIFLNECMRLLPLALRPVFRGGAGGGGPLDLAVGTGGPEGFSEG